MARHRTLLDDRLEATEPCIRFRLIPRYGPFDDRPKVAGSVLELMVSDSVVTARIWLDPLADEPTKEIDVDPSALSEAWIEGILVDFVSKSLRRV